MATLAQSGAARRPPTPTNQRLQTSKVPGQPAQALLSTIEPSFPEPGGGEQTICLNKPHYPRWQLTAHVAFRPSMSTATTLNSRIAKGSSAIASAEVLFAT